MILLKQLYLQRMLFQLLHSPPEFLFIQPVELLVLEKHFIFIICDRAYQRELLARLKSAEGLDHHIAALVVIIEKFLVEPQICTSFVARRHEHIYHVIIFGSDQKFDLTVLALDLSGIAGMCSVGR